MEQLTADVTDSRDIIARIERVESDLDQARIDGDDTTDLEVELKALEEFAEEASEYAPDWHYGKTIIREDYFTQYARELSDELSLGDGATAQWPFMHIDWEAAADELKMDYSVAGFNGIVYYIR
jgi:antirestriction protein